MEKQTFSEKKACFSASEQKIIQILLYFVITLPYNKKWNTLLLCPPGGHSIKWEEIIMANEKILVVDDDTNICELLRLYLTKEGYQVTVANDGEEGLEKFNAVNPANALPPMIPWPVLFLGMLFNNLFYWCTNQSIIQRTLAAKNLAQAQRGAVFTAFLKLLDPFFITICGLLAYRFFGDGLANSDLAYPSLITTVVPNWLLGIIAAVLFGAILSSFNSALNSCVTLYTLDFHRPLFNQTASDSHLVSVGKRVGTGLAIVSICVAPFVSNAPSGLYDFLQECFGFYSMPILAIVLVGFYTKRVPACAPKITLVVHVILYSISKFLPLNVHYLYVLSVLFPVDLALMLLIGKLKPRATDFILEDSKAVDLTPWKYVKPAALTCFILMLCVYALFSPIGLAR